MLIFISSSKDKVLSPHISKAQSDTKPAKNGLIKEKDLIKCQKFSGVINLAQMSLATGMNDLLTNASMMADARQEGDISMEGVKEASEVIMNNVGILGKMEGYIFAFVI